MPKKKIATYWLGGCSGCHMSLLDIDERILEVARLADFVRSPIVDGKEIPEVDIALVEGAVGSEEHLEELLLIRKRSKTLVALGDCAVSTNVTGLRNLHPLKEVMETSYMKADSNDGEGPMPGHPALMRLGEKVRPLHETVRVDVFLRGCPPDADAIFHVLFELLHDRMPDPSKDKNLRYG